MSRWLAARDHSSPDGLFKELSERAIDAIDAAMRCGTRNSEAESAGNPWRLMSRRLSDLSFFPRMRAIFF